ncbi:hypothetical protein BgiBS90_020676, partial [Biomphalaria glabrata]
SERQIDNNRINIDLNMTLVTSTCSNIQYNSLQYLKKLLINSLIYSSDEYYRGLCVSNYKCLYLDIDVDNKEMCVTDPSCSNETCELYKTKFHATFFYV